MPRKMAIKYFLETDLHNGNCSFHVPLK